jgi:restriction system protein
MKGNDKNKSQEMASIPDNINANISPTDFELLVKEYLVGAGKELKDFKAMHNVNLLKSDGEYQIDVYAEFELLGASLKVIVECKRHKSDIKREVVQVLYDKLRATGTHKGMLFSTSGFQSGAYLFAEEHGIALIRVIDGKYTYVTKSHNEQTFDPPPWADIPKYVGQYTKGATTTFIQEGCFEVLGTFLFDNRMDSLKP